MAIDQLNNITNGYHPNGKVHEQKDSNSAVSNKKINDTQKNKDTGINENNSIVINDHVINIIGVDHNDKAAQIIQNYLLGAAMLKNAIVFLEGIPRNEKIENVTIRSWYGVERKGYVYGLEGLFASTFMLAMMCGLFVDADNGNSLTKEFMGNLKNNSFFRKYWNDFGSRVPENSSRLYKGINAYMKNTQDKDLEYFIDNIGTIASFGDKNMWRSMCMSFADSMKEKAFRLGADKEMINSAIAKPGNTDLAEFNQRINIEWRNIFMATNIKNVAGEIDNDLPVFIFVGKMHAQDLADKLSSK